MSNRTLAYVLRLQVRLLPEMASTNGMQKSADVKLSEVCSRQADCRDVRRPRFPIRGASGSLTPTGFKRVASPIFCVDRCQVVAFWDTPIRKSTATQSCGFGRHGRRKSLKEVLVYKTINNNIVALKTVWPLEGWLLPAAAAVWRFDAAAAAAAAAVASAAAAAAASALSRMINVWRRCVKLRWILAFASLCLGQLFFEQAT